MKTELLQQITTQLQLPEVPPAPTFATEVDIENGFWVAYRRGTGAAQFDAERIGSSRLRGPGLAKVLTQAVARGDALTILVRSGTSSRILSRHGRQPQ